MKRAKLLGNFKSFVANEWPRSDARPRLSYISYIHVFSSKFWHCCPEIVISVSAGNGNKGKSDNSRDKNKGRKKRNKKDYASMAINTFSVSLLSLSPVITRPPMSAVVMQPLGSDLYDSCNYLVSLSALNSDFFFIYSINSIA